MSSTARHRLPRTTIAETVWNDDSGPRPTELGLTAGFWALAAAVAGAATWLSARASGIPVSVGGAFVPPLIAACWWVPLTLTAVTLARRLPLHGGDRRVALTVHGLAAVAVSFVLNLLFATTAWMLGSVEASRILDDALGDGLRFFHLNAGAWLAIVATVHLRDALARRRTGSAPDSARRERPDLLAIGTGGRTRFIEIERIDWIEADGDYARIHAGGSDSLCDQRLKHLERSLDPTRFVRIHRSTIVNVERIRSLRHVSHGDYEAILEGGTTLRVSRRRRQTLRQVLGERTLSDRVS